ncbi:hypothetical protein NXC14_CH03469 [Rhizobium sp. NXC14]|uniref:hypothetical protein n=1 Tax=Rhizobium sp. NXC14 TaxID=1981173 RepID=UPI000A2077F0|nr:hypothetical protein [Rhizobium sp. NXC14]ARO31369.1 hypothetical protein NXC14_CH03469 [Rhizobium sp. NXC14]
METASHFFGIALTVGSTIDDTDASGADRGERRAVVFLVTRSFFDTKLPCSFPIASAMRIQIYIIALLLSAIMWSISFDAARESYHAAQSAGLMPNLHINKKLDRIL